VTTSVAPDFFVIGAGRAGTTSLHQYLRQHPGVFLPSTKAPSFFYCCGDGSVQSSTRRRETRNHFVCDPEAYADLFVGASPEQRLGDVSPAYLASIDVPARIAAGAPDARLVAIIRDPAERVRARFDGRRRDGLERRATLAEIVDAEIDQDPWPPDTGGTYVASGFVSHILARYYEEFDRSQILLLTNEELAADPSAVIGDILGFIGADPNVNIDTSTVHNRSGGPIANPIVRRLWTGSARLRTSVRPLVPERFRDAAFRGLVRSAPAERDEATLARLRAHFAEEVSRLSAVVGRDLTPWTRGERLPTEGGR